MLFLFDLLPRAENLTSFDIEIGLYALCVYKRWMKETSQWERYGCWSFKLEGDLEQRSTLHFGRNWVKSRILQSLQIVSVYTDCKHSIRGRCKICREEGALYACLKLAEEGETSKSRYLEMYGRCSIFETLNRPNCWKVAERLSKRIGLFNER